MRLDPNLYRRTLDSIRAQLLKQAKPDPVRTCSELSVANHLPLLSTLLYAMRAEQLGPLPELVESAERIRRFYGYDEVSPWNDAGPALGQVCPFCRGALLAGVTACEPWSPEHLACPRCDSTYPSP